MGIPRQFARRPGPRARRGPSGTVPAMLRRARVRPPAARLPHPPAIRRQAARRRANTPGSFPPEVAVMSRWYTDLTGHDLLYQAEIRRRVDIAYRKLRTGAGWPVVERL